MDIYNFLAILKIVGWLVLALGSVFLFFATCSIYTNLITGVPWAKTPQRNLEMIFKELALPSDSLFYDLGAGDGRALFMAEKFGCRAIGFELSLYPYIKARLKKLLCHSQSEILRQNFFKANLNQADAVFVFLAGQALKRTAEKLKHELKNGAKVISYGFNLPDWKAERILPTKPSRTYIYKI